MGEVSQDKIRATFSIPPSTVIRVSFPLEARPRVLWLIDELSSWNQAVRLNSFSQTLQNGEQQQTPFRDSDKWKEPRSVEKPPESDEYNQQSVASTEQSVPQEDTEKLGPRKIGHHRWEW